MKGLKRGCAALALLGLSSCFGGEGEGRIVGFVVDGQSGQRLNFFLADDAKQNVDDDSDSKSQVYTVIAGDFRRARPCGEGDLNQDNAIQADGCFQIENIPSGMELPLFAQAPGYERFVGRYTYPTHDENVKGSQRVVNVRLFPVGFAVDYRFLVSFEGRPVPGANVVCQYRQATSNTLAVDGVFLSPENTGSTSVMAQSGQDGVAVIPGAQLVNGASYHCEAVVAQQLDGRVLSGERAIVAGVAQAEQRLALTSSATSGGLYALSSSADSPSELHGANGQLTITFNRPVELLSRTTDCHVASLYTSDFDGDGQTGSLPLDTFGNDASETMTATLSADGLTLSLGFQTQQALDSGDRGTAVEFSGVYVRPLNATDGTQVRHIGGGCARGEIYGTASALQNIRVNGAQPSLLRLF